MKQKIIYIVLLVTGMYLPASSNECGKVVQTVLTENVPETKEKPSVAAEDVFNLPVSPFSRLLFNL